MRYSSNLTYVDYEKESIKTHNILILLYLDKTMI